MKQYFALIFCATATTVYAMGLPLALINKKESLYSRAARLVNQEDETTLYAWESLSQDATDFINRLRPYSSYLSCRREEPAWENVKRIPVIADIIIDMLQGRPRNVPTHHQYFINQRAFKNYISYVRDLVGFSQPCCTGCTRGRKVRFAQPAEQSQKN